MAQLTLRQEAQWRDLQSWARRVRSGELQIPGGTRLTQRQMLALGNDIDSRDPEAREALRELATMKQIEASSRNKLSPTESMAKKLEAQWQQGGIFQRIEAFRTNHAQVNARLDARHAIAAKLELQTLPQLQGTTDPGNIGSKFTRRIAETFRSAEIPGRTPQQTQMEEIRLLMKELAILLRAFTQGERIASPGTRKKLAQVRQLSAVA